MILFLGFVGFTVGSFAVVTMVYRVAPFAFFGISSSITISLALVTGVIAFILLVTLIYRRTHHKKRKHY